MDVIGNEGEPTGENTFQNEEVRKIATQLISEEFELDNALFEQKNIHGAAYHRDRGAGMVDLALSLGIFDEGEAEELRRMSTRLSRILDRAQGISLDNAS